MLILYADDIAVIAESAYMLQKGLSALEEWRLSINVSKTKITIVERTSTKTRPNCTYGGNPIEIGNICAI